MARARARAGGSAKGLAVRLAGAGRAVRGMGVLPGMRVWVFDARGRGILGAGVPPPVLPRSSPALPRCSAWLPLWSGARGPQHAGEFAGQDRALVP